MPKKENKDSALVEQDAQTSVEDLVIESDVGARSPSSKFVLGLLLTVAFTWSLFQLWIASPLPLSNAFSNLNNWLSNYLGFSLNFLKMDGTLVRYVHLGFALFLAYLAFPASNKPQKKRNIHFSLWIIAISISLLFYFYIFKSPDAIGGLGNSYNGFINSFGNYGQIAYAFVCLLPVIILFMFGNPGSPRKVIPIADWVMSFLGAFCALYLVIFYADLANRSGAPTKLDVFIAILGIFILLEATRRALGPPLVIIASIFLIYTFFGNMGFVPDIIQHKGQSLNKVASHQWLTTEGVFGVAIGVSSSFVFLFVLFGALLEKAGAGNFFIKLAFSLLGHLRGGPAKAAVLSSGMTGLISGSSIANTVTTGTFTIPLMKRVGFTGEKAGAVEVASSVNGQIMPPVMGAAAFLMIDFVGIPYTEVVRHAFLPAIISYIALLYMVHLEALKANMAPLEKPIKRTAAQSLIVFGISVTSIIILANIVFVIFNSETCFFSEKDAEGNITNALFCINGLKYYATQFSFVKENLLLFISAIILVTYVVLVKYACSVPELEEDDPTSKVVTLPKTAPTLKSGLYFLLPIVVLIWCLMIEKFSPQLSAFWATVVMVFIILTHKPLKSLFRKSGETKSKLREGGRDFYEGMISGARNMIGIAVATASAGIIVGAVSLTGLGPKLTEVVGAISDGSIALVLILTAIICLILGMGLPTTANYIIVATLMAPIVQNLGAQNGLFVPLIAIHLFVFYFGIMADVTPPVGLASFAAASISGADPIKTGLRAFMYSLRTAILPFFFIFNTELILYDVSGFGNYLAIFAYATVAILVFSAVAQGYFITKSKAYESVLLLIVSITLFVPQWSINVLFPKYKELENYNLEEVLSEIPAGEQLRISARGEDMYGELKELVTFIPIKEEQEGDAKKILNKYGLSEFGKTSAGQTKYEVGFNSMAFKTGIEYDFIITSIATPNKQPNPKILFIPAFILLGIIIMIQSVRMRKEKLLDKSYASNTSRA